VTGYDKSFSLQNALKNVFIIITININYNNSNNKEQAEHTDIAAPY